ncbi:GNAT family N-acetyltransferase [Ancylobacter terrae]|uniref:GNAT family N-acetyltransferase n=1 Tax=Ancylobacter sp. sgz301288 TaxID=3342077 RepID=UPI00385DAAC1
MIFRAERPEDHPAIRGLLVDAFGGPAEADLVEQLRADGDAAIALVAEQAGVVVGHVMFSPMAAPVRALALAPVAVAEDIRQQGIASRLINAGLAIARERLWHMVFVLGEPAYYSRFGFDASLAAGFASPYAGPYLMALALNGENSVRTGEIRHAPAFAVFE